MARVLPAVIVVLLCVACGRWARSQTPGAPETAGKPAAGERVVISVGDEKITAAQVEKFIQSLPPNYRTFYSGAGKHLLPQYIVNMNILTKEAVKEKLEDQPDVALAIEIARESILADAARKYIEQSIPVSDQQLREIYDRDKTLSEETRLRHILIQTEAAPLKTPIPGRPMLAEPEARKKIEDIRAKIVAGGDFGELAKEYSDDTATADAGGDMGIVQRDKVVPPIIKAAESLQPGQVSDIIQTPFGLELIQVEVKRTKPFDEVKSALEAQIRRQKATETIQHLSEAYHPVIDQDYFAGPSSVQSPPPSSK